MEFQDDENLLKHVYRAAPIGLCLFDAELRYRHINEWLASINGLSVEAHLGRTISEVIPDVSARVESQLRGVMETGEPVLDGVVEAETPASPRQKRTFQHSYHAVRSDDGIVVGVSCIVQDITRRKGAEDALVEANKQLEERIRSRSEKLIQSESRQRNLLESIQAVPWEADATTYQFTYVGPQAVGLLGFPSQQWLDFDFWPLHIHPEDRNRAVDHCLQSVKSKTDFDFEYRMITADGRTVWIHDIVNVVFEAGEPETLRGIIIDITERKNAEKSLKLSEQRFRSLTKRLLSAQEDERRRLARELHDDLSQRLAAIGIESMSLERRVRTVSESCADEVAAFNNRIRKISADIHQISHQLHPSILDELGLVKAVKGECRAFTRRTGISISFKEPGEHPDVEKRTELAVYRIMQECLHNIAKHSRALSASVELAVNDHEISFSVRDTGIGFDSSEESNVRGVGMASIKERAELLLGNVSIESVIGQGTTVNVMIPRRGMTS